MPAGRARGQPGNPGAPGRRARPFLALVLGLGWAFVGLPLPCAPDAVVNSKHQMTAPWYSVSHSARVHARLLNCAVTDKGLVF